MIFELPYTKIQNYDSYRKFYNWYFCSNQILVEMFMGYEDLNELVDINIIKHDLTPEDYKILQEYPEFLI